MNRTPFIDLLDNKWSFIYIIFTGILFRIATIFFLSDSPFLGDDLGYHIVALQYLKGVFEVPYWPPGISFYLFFFYSIFGASLIVARISMILMYIVFACSLYFIMKQIITRKIANVYLIIFTYFPSFIYFTIAPMTQGIIIPLIIMIFFLLQKINKESKPVTFILLGLMLSLLVLIRPSNLLLCIAIPLHILYKTKKIRNYLIMLAASLLLIISWISFVHMKTGKLVFINAANSRNFFYGNNEFTPLYRTWPFGEISPNNKRIPAGYLEMVTKILSMPLDEQEKFFFNYTLNNIKTRPDLFVIRTTSRIRSFFAFNSYTGSTILKKMRYTALNRSIAYISVILDFFFHIFIILTSLVLILLDENKARNSLKSIILIISMYAIPYWISFSSGLYCIPLMPLIGILSAISLDSLSSMEGSISSLYKKASGKRRLVFILTVLFFLYIQAEYAISQIVFLKDKFF